ncbi:MAG: hypothetical protein OEY18_15615, partial [Candidatus Aminicenantes bacterium]|nr:hypothetical protein [Candidatus Aminicenantes bacterium]
MISMAISTRRNIYTFLDTHPAMKLILLFFVFMTGTASLTKYVESRVLLMRDRIFIRVAIQALQPFMYGMGEIIFDNRIVFPLFMALNTGTAFDFL